MGQRAWLDGATASDRFFVSVRCLFIIPWGPEHVGGVNQVVNNLSLQFDDFSSGSAVVLNSEYGYDRVERRVQENGVPLLHLTLREPQSSGRGWREPLSFLRHLPGTVRRLGRVLRDEDIDAVNCHYPGLASIAVVIAARVVGRRRNVILSFHGADISRIESSGRLARVAWRWVLAGSSGIVTCSHALKSRLASLFPEFTDRIRVVHNGIDSNRLLAAAGTGRVPGELAGSDYILNAATFEHKKGQDTLISAFSVLADRYPGVKLVMMGRNGGSLAGLQKQVSDVGLAGRVAFFEDVPHADLLATMAGARLFALPSRIEPFGIVLLEAALFRVPVVASGVGGIVEIVDRDRDTGVLLPPDDVDAWVAALEDCLRNPEVARDRAERLHREVQERFSWRQAAAEYRRLLGSDQAHVRGSAATP